MTYYDLVSKTPDLTARFLRALASMETPPWEVLFRRRVCSKCDWYFCELCPNHPETEYAASEYELAEQTGKNDDKHGKCKYRNDRLDAIDWWLRQETTATLEARNLVTELLEEIELLEYEGDVSNRSGLIRRSAMMIIKLLQDFEYS